MSEFHQIWGVETVLRQKNCFKTANTSSREMKLKHLKLITAQSTLQSKFMKCLVKKIRGGEGTLKSDFLRTVGT